MKILFFLILEILMPGFGSAKEPTLPVCSTHETSGCATDPRKISPGWHRVSAQEAALQAQAACLPDVKKFCKDVKNGDARIARCLVKHAAKLRPACRAYVGQVSAPPAADVGSVPPFLAAPAHQ